MASEKLKETASFSNHIFIKTRRADNSAKNFAEKVSPSSSPPPAAAGGGEEEGGLARNYKSVWHLREPNLGAFRLKLVLHFKKVSNFRSVNYTQNRLSSRQNQSPSMLNVKVSSTSYCLLSILIHKFSPCLHLAAPGELCDHVLSGMLHSLSGFPVQIGRGVIGCDLYRLIFFSYRLLRAAF